MTLEEYKIVIESELTREMLKSWGVVYMVESGRVDFEDRPIPRIATPEEAYQRAKDCTDIYMSNNKEAIELMYRASVGRE